MRVQRAVLGVACVWLLCAPSARAQTVAAGAEHTAVVTPDGIVWTWGSNVWGQLGDGTTTARRVPDAVPVLTGVTRVAAGASHTLALKSDGTVWAWGANFYGQLGDGTTTPRSEPVPVGGLSGVVAIAAGDYHSIAMTSDGHVWTWGANTKGQLGDGTTTLSTQPIVVSTTLTVSAIAGGGTHTLVVQTDGTVWGWGNNANGQLGDGSTTQRTLPVQMSGITAASTVAGGALHSLVLLTSGTVRAVGYNLYGQLGDTTTTQRTSSVAVSSLTTVTAIAAGGHSSYARRSDGSLWGWGSNGFGQVGDGTTTNRSAPTQVASPIGVALIAAGGSHALAVTSTGVVWTWGANAGGQLGDGTAQSRSSPGAISGDGYAWKVATPVFSVPAGTYTVEKSVVVTCDTAGADIHYTLTGDPPSESDPVIASGSSLTIDETRTVRARAWKTGMPASDLTSATYTLAVAGPQFSPSGGTYTSARTVSISTSSPGATIRYTIDGLTPSETSTVYTDPLTISTSTTVKALGLRANWSSSSVATATYTMNFGTLAAPLVSPGSGTVSDDVTIEMSALAGATIRYTTNGSTPTGSSPVYAGPVLITASGTVNAKAFHPDYTTSPMATATYTIAVATPIIAPGSGTYGAGQVIAASTATSRATLTFTTNGSAPTSTSALFPAGGLVAGNFTLKVAAWRTGATPSPIATASYRTTGPLTPPRIVGGTSHTLALRSDGLAFGWGTNSSGQLGDGTTTARALPVIVNGAAGVVAIVAGDIHSLALTGSGEALAWGSNASGRLGDGTTANRSVPTAIPGLSGLTGLAGGASHSLAVKADGTVWAWGHNASGQLGTGDLTQRLIPTQVLTLTNITRVAAGGSSSFAIDATGGAWSWGANGNGQLGSGTTAGRTTPGPVVGISNVSTITAGPYHTLALVSDGTVRAWGYNQYGQLGDGTSMQRTSPVSVGGLSGVVAVAAGASHSLALDADGIVWAWGSNANGAIGDGTTTNRNTPVTIAGLPVIVAIGAGSLHSLAVAEDGSVWAWGRNADQQLGDGTSTMRTSPVQIAGPGMAWKIATPVLSVPSGLYDTAQTVTITCADPDAVLHYTLDGTDPTEEAAVMTSGSARAIDVSTTLKVRAWKPGAVSSEVVTGIYQLKVIAPVLSPISGPYVSPQSITVTTATPAATFTYTTDGTEPDTSSAAYAGAIAVSDTRSIKARAYKTGWTPSESVVASYWISGGVTATPTIAPAGGASAGAVLVTLASDPPDSTIRYTLDGTDPTVASPVYAFPILISTATTVKARAFRANGLPSAVAMATFSFVSEGPVARPSIAPGGGRFATQQTAHITGPAGATVRYTTTGVDPTTTDAEVPATGDLLVSRSQILKVRAWSADGVPSVVSRADFVLTGAIASGAQHHLALAADGQVWGWGRNFEGQVGNGSVDATIPEPVAVLTDAVAIAANGYASLAVRGDGTVWNWGHTATGGSRVPVQVAGLADVSAVSAGDDHALALTRDGTVWAWGYNATGQLGDGTSTTRTTPVQVIGLSGVTSIAAGDGFSLAVQRDGAEGGLVWAWGANASGQLGDGSSLTRLVPVRVIGVDAATQVAAGQAFAMAALADGSVRAWGADESLQLGDMEPGASSTPVAIPLLARAVGIAGGRKHAVAIDDEGRAWGWGWNGTSQLGQRNYDSDLGVGAPVLVPAAAATVAASGGTWTTLVLRADGSLWYTGSSNGTPDHLTLVPSLTLVENTFLFVDADHDGLLGWQEYLAGTDPLSADTNGNGLSDLVDVRRRSQASNPDSDGDGVPDVVEATGGTDPFQTDTDGDGTSDLLDAFPLDPTRTLALLPVPGDTTPPTITLTLPASARPIGGGL